MKPKIIVPNKQYSNLEDIAVMSWAELIEQEKSHLQQREAESLQLIQNKLEEYKDAIPIILTSTGKDSNVLLHLVRQVIPNAHAMFSNSSLDCADTYKMAKTIENCDILNPSEGFYQYCKRLNWIPSRVSRGCCSVFKAGEMSRQLDHNVPYMFFEGIRNEESPARKNYEDEVVNPEWGQCAWKGILPIRQWSEMDIWLYTMWKDIPVNPKYKKGYSRAGCAIACPYASKSTWNLDKYWYPTMRDRWENILRNDFINNNKWLIMNCTLKEYITEAWSGTVYRPEPTEDVVNEFASYNNLELQIARKYFNKYCANKCIAKGTKSKRIKDKTTLAMNMKYHGRDTTKFLCKKCFMEEHEMTQEQWDEQVALFKQQGCDLF